jgi:membrane fusion protein (multidrug efflux system)
VAIGGVLAVVGLLGGIKACQISSLMAMGKQQQKAGPPPEAVGTAVAKEESWEGTLSAVGSVTSLKSVGLSNDAAGLVTRIAFESGATVKAGQVLLELDTSVERAQLASAQAQRELAVSNLKRTRSLIESGSIPKAQLDTDEAALKAGTTAMDAIQAQIGRKTLRAPFDGRLGIRNVNLGQYLNPGTTVTVLEASNAAFVDFTLPQQRLPDVAVGMKVRMSEGGDGGAEWEGAVTAVDPTVDNVTRSIKLRATAPSDKLRPGMFLNVTVVLPERSQRVVIPGTGVVHASYGDSVFVVEDKKARQQFVRLGEARGDFIAILDGVKPGQEIVTAGAFKLRNGSPVAVNNTVQPKPELNPRPENH